MVNVTGSAGDDHIRVDLSATALPAVVSINGGGGSDTLVGPAADTTWTISGVNSGTVAGIGFTGFSALLGSSDNADTFVLGASGSVSGSVDGGSGGEDALVGAGSDGLGTTTMSAGHLVLPGRTLDFHGFELIATGLAGAVGSTNPQTTTVGVTTSGPPAVPDVTFNLPDGLPAAAPDPSTTPGSGPSPPAQVILLVFGGALDVDYDGPISVHGIDVPAFVAPARLSGQEALIIAAIKAAIERKLAGQNVIVTLDRPVAGTDYSTIYIGGTDAAFAGYGPLFALSEKVDSGNADHNDIAFVFSAPSPTRGKTVAAYAEEIAEYAAHEAGHLLGYEHMRTAHSHDAGDVLGEVAFKPYTHVEIAKDVRNDLIEDGYLDIVGVDSLGHEFTTQYSVHPRVLEAIIRFPGHYYAGTVGPDGFPDVTFGQRIIHPIDTGTWLARVFDMAWAAQELDQLHRRREAADPRLRLRLRDARCGRLLRPHAGQRVLRGRLPGGLRHRPRRDARPRRRERDPPPPARGLHRRRDAGLRRQRRPQPAARRRHQRRLDRRGSPTTPRSASSTRPWSSRSPATRRRPLTPAPAARSSSTRLRRRSRWTPPTWARRSGT